MNVTISSLALSRFIRPTLLSKGPTLSRNALHVSNSLFKYGFTKSFLNNYNKFTVKSTSIVKLSQEQTSETTLKRMRIEDDSFDVSKYSCFDGCFIQAEIVIEASAIFFKQCYIQGYILADSALFDRCTLYEDVYVDCTNVNISHSKAYSDTYIYIIDCIRNSNLTKTSCEMNENTVLAYSSFLDLSSISIKKADVSFISIQKGIGFSFYDSSISDSLILDSNVSMKTSNIKNIYSNCKVYYSSDMDKSQLIRIQDDFTIPEKIPTITPRREATIIYYKVKRQKEEEFSF